MFADITKLCNLTRGPSASCRLKLESQQFKMVIEGETDQQDKTFYFIVLLGQGKGTPRSPKSFDPLSLFIPFLSFFPPQNFFPARNKVRYKRAPGIATRVRSVRTRLERGEPGRSYERNKGRYPGSSVGVMELMEGLTYQCSVARARKALDGASGGALHGTWRAGVELFKDFLVGKTAGKKGMDMCLNRWFRRDMSSSTIHLGVRAL